MDLKYIGMDVHTEAIAIAVMNGEGKLVMESIIETQASTILQFIQGLRGDLHVTSGTKQCLLHSQSVIGEKNRSGPRGAAAYIDRRFNAPSSIHLKVLQGNGLN